MIEFAIVFALVGLTIAAIGGLMFTLLARHGLIRNAEEEVRRVNEQLDRERTRAAEEARMKTRMEDAEAAVMALKRWIETSGGKVEGPPTMPGKDPEIFGDMPELVGGTMR